MNVRKTKRGVTIQLSDAEAEELLGATGLSLAAYNILQNFMNATQKQMTWPSIVFLSRMAGDIWQARDGAADGSAEGQPPAG